MHSSFWHVLEEACICSRLGRLKNSVAGGGVFDYISFQRRFLELGMLVGLGLVCWGFFGKCRP